MRPLLLLIALLTLAGPVHAELPSGTVAQLLDAAEAGSTPALYALAAGLPQLSVDSDTSLQQSIDSRQIPPQWLDQLNPASAALAIGIFHLITQTDETQAMAFYCRWTQRALALLAKAPSNDPETQAQ